MSVPCAHGREETLLQIPAKMLEARFFLSSLGKHTSRAKKAKKTAWFTLWLKIRFKTEEKSVDPYFNFWILIEHVWFEHVDWVKTKEVLKLPYINSIIFSPAHCNILLNYINITQQHPTKVLGILHQTTLVLKELRVGERWYIYIYIFHQ